MRSLPSGSVEIVREAMPLFMVELPNNVEPLVNVTVPVTLVGESVSMNVTALPGKDGLTEEVNVPEVSTLFTVCVTVPTAAL